jgi:hypothetical protein
MVYATPIMDLGSSDVVATSSLANVKVVRAAGATLDSAGIAANFYTLGAANWSSPANGTCMLSGDCQTTTKIPEPQSLVLVGSGLLSMAGYIRRRLAR